MHALYEEMALKISSGLKRRSVTTCSQWAEQFRILGGKHFPGPWRFTHHPWLREMHDSNARFNVGRKAAQMGFTEAVLNRTFFKIDIERVDCLYVLPATTPDASNFSASRFDAALELSPHLSKLFSAVKNVGHKRAGSTNLYIRGSKSRSGLKSVPVGFLVLDEVNEMNEANIPLAFERQAGQVEKEAWMISTPTAEGFGIDKYFLETTQEHFYFKCPSCGKFTELIFPECLEITGTQLNDPNLKNSFLKCKECNNKLIHELKHQWLAEAKWIPTYTGYDDRGFYINQLYSPTVNAYELAVAYLKSLANIADEQEFWNSKLGLPHTPEGARINDKHIIACLKQFKNGDLRIPSKIITMGVDVGKWLHYEIDAWTIPDQEITDLSVESMCRAIKIGKCKDFEELDRLMAEYRIDFCVIDAHPERRKAFEFANRNYGRVRMCIYGRGVQGKQIHVGKDAEPLVTVDRTSWLDLSLGRFRTEMIELPMDTPEEYKEHLKALVRFMQKDADGNPYGVYEKRSNDQDHYAHARNYSEIAFPFSVSSGVNQDILDSPI